MSAIQPNESSWQVVETSVAIVASTALLALTCLVRDVFNRTVPQSREVKSARPLRALAKAAVAMPPPEAFKTTRTGVVDPETHLCSGPLWKCVAEHRSEWFGDGVVYEFEFDDSIAAHKANGEKNLATDNLLTVLLRPRLENIFNNFVDKQQWNKEELREALPFSICGFGFDFKPSSTVYAQAGDRIFFPSPEILRDKFGLDVIVRSDAASHAEFIEDFLDGKFTISKDEFTHDLSFHAAYLIGERPIEESVRDDIRKFYAEIKTKKASSDREVQEAAELAELILSTCIDQFTANDVRCFSPLTSQNLVGFLVDLLCPLNGYGRSTQIIEWWERETKLKPDSLGSLHLPGAISTPGEEIEDQCNEAFKILGLDHYDSRSPAAAGSDE
ncbi:MAG: hypothetical protein P0S96_06195 [Simkaniaceae bacterium]|nr:hypothetical protein [Candidatus Sacchlamyda saccharinae]